MACYIKVLILEYIKPIKSLSKSRSIGFLNNSDFFLFLKIFEFKYREKLGRPVCAVHGLRRAVGTNMVVAGIPVTTVAQVLGHSRISATKQYISLDSAHLKQCVSYNDLGSLYFKKLFKTVVSGNNASVKLVEVTGCKSSAVKLYHRTDIRRKYGDNVKDHPLELVARLSERLDYLESLDKLGFLLTGSGDKLVLDLCGERVDVYLGKKLLDSRSTHAYTEFILVHLAVFHVLLLGKNGSCRKGCRTGIENYVFCKVEYLLKLLLSHVEDMSHSGGDSLEVPDM